MVPTYGIQVRAHDGEVGWGEFLDSLELHDNLVFDEQVEPMQSHLDTLVDNWDSELTSECDSAVA